MAGKGEAYFWSSDRVPLCHEHDLADFLAAVGAESGGGGSGGEGRGATAAHGGRGQGGGGGRGTRARAVFEQRNGLQGRVPEW